MASYHRSLISHFYDPLYRLTAVDSVGNFAATYTLDIAAGPTQVLEDGTNAYLYGVERIAQEEASRPNRHYFSGIENRP